MDSPPFLPPSSNRHKPRTQLPGMVETPVQTVDEALACIAKGRGQRAVAATKVHEHSSRSHSIVMVTVSPRQSSGSSKPPGRLFLVDLAGSERVKKSGVSGEELKEAQHINRSVCGWDGRLRTGGWMDGSFLGEQEHDGFFFFWRGPDSHRSLAPSRPHSITHRSLSALGDVMEALDRKQAHVPYRNSKLTHLLQVGHVRLYHHSYHSRLLLLPQSL